MRKRRLRSGWLALLLALWPALARGQGAVANGSRNVSTFLSGVNESDTAGCDANSSSSQTVYHVCTADPTLSGNSILVVCTAGNSTRTLTVTDDKSNSYTTLIGPVRHSGGQDLWIALASNAAAGTHQITATWSASISGVQCGAYQLYHVLAASPSCGTAVSATSAGNTTVSAGSITSSVANCIYIQASVIDTVAPASTQTVGSSWNWEDVDVRVGWAVQTKVNPTASAMTCSHTQASGDGFVTACVALKPDNSQGTAPSGMYVRNTAIFVQQDTTTSYTYQTPCPGGNLLVWATNTGATTPSVTGISHTSPSGSSAQVGSGVTGGEGVQQVFWDVQTWTNATTHTLTMSGSGNNNDVTYYCIAGAASTGQPDSSLGTASGTDSSAPGTLNTYAITPSSSSGIMIGTTGVALGHTTSCGPAGYQDNMDNNNNWCRFAYSSTASQQFSITKTGSGAGAWSGAGAAFKSASAASAAPAFDKRKKLDRLETQ